MEIVIPGATNIGLFVGAALVLLLVPGPAVLYIVARSVAQGRMAGFVSDLGIHSATLVHVLAAALGLSALLASSALAFSIVKYAGAAYLIWLGLKKIFGRADEVDADGNLPRHSYARLFRDGFIVNLLNPKTALFFLAFLPQFVEPERGHLVTQIVFLGLLFCRPGLHHRRLLRPDRRHGRQVAEAEPPLPRGRALRQRHPVHRPRPDRGVRGKPEEVAPSRPRASLHSPGALDQSRLAA